MEFVFRPGLPALSFWCVTALWIAEFLVFRSRVYGESRGGRRSYVLIFSALIVTFVLTGVLYHFRLGNLEGSWQRGLRWSALALYALGVGLRYWAAWCLGSWFSRGVEARRDQSLVSSGPYRFLRHPLYLGLFLLGVGLSGVMANPPGLMISVLVLGSVLNLRMIEEERMLETTIGARYRRWKERRYRFLPFVY